MTKRASYSITVDGVTVTRNFAPYLTSLTIKDGEGGKSDKLDIALDDMEGRLKFPRTGADIVARLWWDGEGKAVEFRGKTDEPESEGSRGGGMTLSISASSADLKGKTKEKKKKHKDDATFGDVAKEWGKAAGLDVKIDDALAAIKRDYWVMDDHSFLSWGQAIAEEIGATFKISGDRAVFVERNSGKSSSGQDLPAVEATRPGNVISWKLSPQNSRAKYKTSVVRWYDDKAAKWMSKTVDIGGDDASVKLVETQKAADADKAGRKAKSNSEESKRDSGSGSITIDGNPNAQAQGRCIVSGVRAGIDGEYRITSVTHSLTRSGGWTTSLELKQPQGSAGKDDRKKS